MKTKRELFSAGRDLMEQFCGANGLSVPEIIESTRPHDVGTCAYYRASTITIHVKSCAAPGVGGACWSWPGFTIDRTPYGVIQHELGHHVDCLFGETPRAYSSEFSVEMRAASGEDKLTNYCLNDAEWFAEMFRLFVTNPDLLNAVRPKTYGLMCERLTPVVPYDWAVVLDGAPARVITQCIKKARLANVAPAHRQLDLIGGES